MDCCDEIKRNRRMFAEGRGTYEITPSVEDDYGEDAICESRSNNMSTWEQTVHLAFPKRYEKEIKGEVWVKAQETLRLFNKSLLRAR